jgi:hypothetical protein
MRPMKHFQPLLLTAASLGLIAIAPNGVRADVLSDCEASCISSPPRECDDTCLGQADIDCQCVNECLAQSGDPGGIDCNTAIFDYCCC